MRKESKEFYDNYIDNQKLFAFNKRHFIVYDKLKELGLSENSNVLELGCGIGVITSLIAKTVRKGEIIAVDLSEKSIELAKKRNKNAQQINFMSSDITKLVMQDKTFDFITLVDVIEHIPIKLHNKLFEHISEMMDEHSTLFINIPSPEHIAFIKKHKPELLQIIDQEIYADELLKNTYSNKLALQYFKTYSIWQENDYQMMVFSKQKEFSNKTIHAREPIFAKIKKRFL